PDDRALDDILRDNPQAGPRSAQIDWHTVSASMNEFRSLGRFLAEKLFHGDLEHCRNLQDLCKKALPTWGIRPRTDPPWDEQQAPSPVEIVADRDTLIPLELLPVFSPIEHDDEQPLRITSDLELAKAASNFLGFSTCVRRRLRRQGSEVNHALLGSNP